MAPSQTIQPPQTRKLRFYKTKKENALYFEVNTYLKSLTGCDLTKIPGIDGNTALKLLGEIGLDMKQWKSEKHFASWLLKPRKQNLRR